MLIYRKKFWIRYSVTWTRPLSRLPAWYPGDYQISPLKYPRFISIFPVRTWNSLIERPKFWKWASLRLDRENYQEIIQSLQTGQTRVNNVQQILIYLHEEEEEDKNWVLNILEDLVTVVMDDGSQLNSLDITGSGASSVDWASLPPEILAQVLVSLKEQL